MSLNDRNSMAAPDILQLNMEIITKELNDLVVTADRDFGIARQFSMTTVETTARSFVTVPEQDNYDMPTYFTNTFYDQQRFCSVQGIPNLDFNLNNYHMRQQPLPYIQPQYSDQKPNHSNSANYIKTKHVLDPSISSSNAETFSNVIDTPTYEFHYLRARGEKDRRLSNSETSLSGQGALRKINKQHPKHVYQKIQNSYANTDEISFDLSTLPFPDNTKENSNVRRIFDLLQDLYRAIAETPASFNEDSGSQFEETFVFLHSKKSMMPSTLNIQNQVKQACRKLTIFIAEMRRILSAIKMCDIEMHNECEFYLNQLQQYLNQLELYKGIVMEHKHGQFLREEINAHAERLSLLLEHTNQLTREVHVRIFVADWYIGIKYRGDVTAASKFEPEVTKKSRIGVINEILQMCNKAESESVNYNTARAAAATTATATARASEALKPETSFKANKQILLNKEAANVEPLLITNDNFYNIYKPKRTTTIATTGSQPARNPVFYIG